jgi:osomolarity two-component system, sensor histidine kinase SLN1
MATLFYCTAGPVIALFALNQRRLIMFFASLAWIFLVIGLIVPARPSFMRNVVNVALFQGFVLFIHYMQEMGSRRMYTLRAELKVSFIGLVEPSEPSPSFADLARSLPLVLPS